MTSLALGPPVRKQGLQKTVYLRIRKGILSGAIPPGGTLKIGELAKALNVSANPVREALRQLEAEGMVHFAKNRRIEVVRLSLEDLKDIYSIMGPLEEIGLEKCFKLVDEATLSELESLCLDMKKEDLSSQEWVELNHRFHSLLHKMTGSPRLAGILGRLRDHITPYLNIAFDAPTRIGEAILEHDGVVQSLKEGDLEKGKAIIRSHLNNGCEAIAKLLEEEMKPELL